MSSNSSESIVIFGYVLYLCTYLCSWGLTLRSAGIIGLDVALVLAEKGYGRSITVVAEFLPGDTSIRYTSPACVHWRRSPCSHCILTNVKGWL